MISAEEAFKKHGKSFTCITEKEIMAPRMPREDVIGEAEELKLAALADVEALVKAGCPRDYVTTLDERIGAYAHASSLWENFEFEKTDAKKQWLVEEGPAYEFKAELLHELQHALRKNPAELKYVSKISAGSGRRDLVVDLKDITVLGKKNEDALKAIGFDVTKLDEASALHEKLSDLLSAANMNPEKLEELKTQAYQAYTFLQQAIAEIRANGQYAFWKNENRLNLYKSDHYQSIGKNRKTTGETSA